MNFLFFLPRSCDISVPGRVSTREGRRDGVQAAAEAQARKIKRNVSQGISNSVWALATVGLFCESLFGAAADEMTGSNPSSDI